MILMESNKLRWGLCYAIFISLTLSSLVRDLGVSAEGVNPHEAKQLRDEVREMFYHAFDGYMNNAFPLDELKPLSCQGEDTLGGYALTLIDSLDTLALLGDRESFTSSVQWIGKNLQFNIVSHVTFSNKTVSVFETTIRVLGGLLSAHLIASDCATGMRIPSYDNELLVLAEDLARRMLPAFDTPTGIPYGSITSTAGGGTLTLEFGVLSRLTNDPVFEQVAKNAVRGLWARRSTLDLVGAHINVFTGEWTQKDAGIGTSIDSFYEYLLKAYILFGDEEYLYIFQEAYGSAMHHLHKDPWYVEVNMDSGAIVWPVFNSLQAFWPGLQVLAGDVDPAIRTHTAFFSVWKRYGFTPEGFNLATLSVQYGQKSYPLRPELIESTYWLYKATRDPRYLDAGRDFVASLQYGAKCPCAVDSDNLVDNGPYKYIFSTEGHLLPLTPQISLAREHCSYFGGYCPRNATKFEQSNDDHQVPEIELDHHSNIYPYHESFPVTGLIKGLCPRLSHAQKYGLSYVLPEKTEREDVKRPKPVITSRSIVLVSDQTVEKRPQEEGFTSESEPIMSISGGGSSSDQTGQELTLLESETDDKRVYSS
ncbi:hypothetical protein Bca4012_051493 [Brassica carinata]